MLYIFFSWFHIRALRFLCFIGDCCLCILFLPEFTLFFIHFLELTQNSFYLMQYCLHSKTNLLEISFMIPLFFALSSLETCLFAYICTLSTHRGRQAWCGWIYVYIAKRQKAFCYFTYRVIAFHVLKCTLCSLALSYLIHRKITAKKNSSSSFTIII